MRSSASTGACEPPVMALPDVLGDFSTWDDEEVGAVAGRLEAHKNIVEVLRVEVFGFPVQKPKALAILIGLDLYAGRLGGVSVGDQDIDSASIAKGNRSHEPATSKLSWGGVLA